MTLQVIPQRRISAPESIGYELGVLLRSAGLEFIMQSCLVGAAWILDPPTKALSIVLLLLVIVSFFYSIFYDSYLLNEVPSPNIQTVRVSVDICMFVLLSGFILNPKLNDRQETDEERDRQVAAVADEILDYFGPILSIFVFSFCLYLANIASLSAMRVLWNCGLAFWKVIMDIGESLVSIDEDESDFD